MKKTLLILLAAVCSFTAAKAVLKEKDLNQTISVLRAELENSYNEQKEFVARYNSSVAAQHKQMVAIMQKSYQISLMLYSQKEDYTFDLCYACHEATEQYREFKLNRMPFDKIVVRLNSEIKRYNSLLETLVNLPPSKKWKISAADSARMAKKGGKLPFALNSQSQRYRDVCIEMATQMRDNLVAIKSSIEADKRSYSQIEKRLKRINDYAGKRYTEIQKSIFVNGGNTYFEVLSNLGRYFDVAKSDAEDKYQSESINTKDGVTIKVKSQWRGPVVLFLAVFVIFYLAVASVLSGVVVRWVVPKRFRTEEFMKKKVCIMLVAAVVIFALVLSVVRTFMGNHNFILMASSLLIELAWLIGVILMSLLIRLNGDQIKSGFKVYTPVMVMGFIIITCRIIFIPNNLVNLVLPPVLLAVSVWNWFVVMRNHRNIPRSDVFYTWISIVIMGVSTVASWAGYTLLGVQILIWWLFQLTGIQTITCLFHLLGLYELRYLAGKIKGLMPAAGKGAKLAELNGENLAKAVKKLKDNRADYINRTWFFDFIYMVVVPVMGVVSIILSIWCSADVFDLTGSIYEVFFINFLNIPGVIALSLQKMVMAMSLWFLFKYINYLLKALYKKYKKTSKTSGNKPNITLANNIIGILVWGSYIVICMIMLHIPAGAIETVCTGLAAGLGFAMKDLLENFFYGISLMSGRVRVGDYIECDGIRGKVESITYQSTQIVTTADGSVMAFLNSALFSKNFKNLTRNNSYEFVKLPVGVAYGTNIEQVRQILIEAVSNIHAKTKDGRDVISTKRPMGVVVDEFGDNSVDLSFTCWVMVEEKAAIVSRIKETVYNTLNEHNIEIPFPQRDIYIKNYNKEQTTQQ